MHIIDTRGKRSTATKTEYFDCFVKKNTIEESTQRSTKRYNLQIGSFIFLFLYKITCR